MAWYRNAGRGKYHRAREDWVRSGRAVCGANISRPGFVARDREEVERTRNGACKHCENK